MTVLENTQQATQEKKETTQLRILRLEDFPAVWQIFAETFPTKYQDEFRFSWLSRATAYSWALWQNESLKGFIITSFQAELENSYHIHFIGTHPSVQKGGFGTTLLHKVIQQAFFQKKPVTLIPIMNERLIRWYEKQGFSFLSDRKPIISPYTGEEEQLMIIRGT
jgi:ribosomal protein S18 acetylase RimI-like enzyme